MSQKGASMNPIELACLFVTLLVRVLTFAIIARALLSWFVRDPANPVVGVLQDITEPVVGPVRRLMPDTGMIDFSPLVALIVLQILEVVLRSLICPTL
jgi:YggT family protein